MNDDALKSIMTRLALLETRIDRAASADMPYTEFGPWTPTWKGSTGDGSYTYTNQFGEYGVLGNLVFLTGRISISAITVAPTGVILIGGLPYASSATNNVSGVMSAGEWGALTLTAGYTYVSGNIASSSSVISVRQSGSGVASGNIAVAGLGAAASIIFSAVYSKV